MFPFSFNVHKPPPAIAICYVQRKKNSAGLGEPGGSIG